MKNWFSSLQGAITLSVIALVTEAWRGFLDAMFVLPTDFGDKSMMESAALIFTLLFAAWAWTLISTAQGSRGGLIAASVLNAVIWVAVPVSWLFVYCPVDCQAHAGIFNLANSLNLFSILSKKSFNSEISVLISESSSSTDFICLITSLCFSIISCSSKCI